MKLSDLFRGQSGGEVVISQKNLNMLRLNRQIRSLAPGHTIQGEVISKKGSEVQIRLTDDFIISARLERDLSMEVGRLITFEVRNNGKALTLSPLFANTASDANVSKALDMANIPVNERSVEMTQSMMEQGMSVERNNLQSVYRDVLSNMDASVRDIVQLHQLGIEVTPENLNQLSNYHAFSHQLTEGMNQMIHELIGQVDGMIQAGEQEQALFLISKLHAVLDKPASDFLNPSSALAGQEVTEDSVSANETAVIQNEGTGTDNQSGLTPVKQEVPAPETIFQGAEGGKLFDLLREMAITQNDPVLGNVLAKIQQGTISVSEIIENIGAKPFADCMKELILENWLLEPEMVADKENVEKLYNRIQKQLSEISRILSDTGSAQTGNVLKTVTTMQQNLDFINQINQTFLFLQLPLQMNGKETHGELYVYTNKKNLAREDGNVSAFLHLDMEHLGPVDVYVAMQNQKVNTKFYLKNDEMLDFIHANIHILNERLSKRGYTMNCEMFVSNQEEISIVDRITDSGKNVSVLSQYAFDVRA